MKWYRDLYLDERIKKSKEQLIKKAETNAGLPGIYLITLAANGRDLLDVFAADLLFFPALHGRCPMIVGAAKGKDAAVSLAAKIAMEAYRSSGNFDIPRYLRGRMPDGQEIAWEYPTQRLKKKRRFGFRQ